MSAPPISISELRAKMAAMSRGPYKHDMVNGTVDAMGAGANQFLSKIVCEMYVSNHQNNAEGIVGVLNAADVLIEIAEAANRCMEAWHKFGLSRLSQWHDEVAKLDAALAKVRP